MAANYLGLLRDRKAPPVDTSSESAIEVLNRHGVRRLQLNGVFTIAVRRCLLGVPEIREAIRTLYGHHVHVVALEDPRVPERFRAGNRANQ